MIENNIDKEEEKIINLEKKFLDKIGEYFTVPLDNKEIVHGEKTECIKVKVPTWKHLTDFEISTNMTKYFHELTSISEEEINNFSASTTAKIDSILGIFQTHFTIDNKKKEKLLRSCLSSLESRP